MATRAKEEQKGTKIAAVAGLGRRCDYENQGIHGFGPVEGLKINNVLILRHGRARLWILRIRRYRHTL